MGDAVAAKKRISKDIGKKKVSKKHSTSCKPEVMLVTEDVTLPIMKPIKVHKSYPVHGSGKEGIKIVRQPETKRMARKSFLEPPPSLYEKRAAERYEVYKDKQNLEKTVSMPPRNSSILDAYFHTKLKANLLKKEKPSLPFPNTVKKAQMVSISHKEYIKSDNQENSPPSNQSVRKSPSMYPIAKTAPQNPPKPRKKQLRNTAKRKPPPKDTISILNKPIIAKKSSEPFAQPRNPSLQAVLNLRIATESSSSCLSTPVKSLQGFYRVAEGEQNRANTVSRHTSRSSHSERELKVYDYKNDSSRIDSRRSITKSMRSLAETDSRSRSSRLLPLKDVKYSWQDINSWVPPYRRKRENCTTCEEERDMSTFKDLDCKIKYSWQVIGIGSQTSRTLLQDLLDGGDGSGGYRCDVKYSWQIIGTATQASMENYGDADYWHGLLLTPRANYKSSLDSKNGDELGNGKCRRNLIILNNKDTQTFAQKQNQTDFTDCRAKYSWENVLKQYL